MKATSRPLVVAVGLLLATLAAWTFLRYRPTTAALLFAGSALPWLLLWRRLVRGDRRGSLWSVLLVAPYLGYGLMEVLANPGARALAAIQVLLSFAVFVAAIAHLRLSRPPVPAPNEPAAR